LIRIPGKEIFIPLGCTDPENCWACKALEAHWEGNGGKRGVKETEGTKVPCKKKPKKKK
jgi:hypothetical protein